jgi:hypothetical protein
MTEKTTPEEQAQTAQLLAEISALRHMVEVLYAQMFQQMPDPAGAARTLSHRISRSFDGTFKPGMSPFEALVGQYTLAALEGAFDRIENRLGSREHRSSS